jgi:hypothetical protein
MNNASMLQYEKLRKKTIEVEREKLMEEMKEYRRILQHLQA